MAAVKLETLKAMKNDELHNELERLRRHLFDLRAQAVTEKLENPMQLGQTKRTIAQILTLLRQRGDKNIEQRQAHMTARSAQT